VEATDPPPSRLRELVARRAELDERIRYLHQRNAELLAGSGGADYEHRAVGSTPDQVTRAERLARTANQRALEASRRAAMMRLHAAGTHDQAARLHDQLADAGGEADPGQHREQAAKHRRLAGEDRAAADAIFRSHRVEAPEAGDS
jgi:hypothetical protein